jgi:hypothetical protein
VHAVDHDSERSGAGQPAFARGGITGKGYDHGDADIYDAPAA